MCLFCFDAPSINYEIFKTQSVDTSISVDLKRHLARTRMSICGTVKTVASSDGMFRCVSCKETFQKADWLTLHLKYSITCRAHANRILNDQIKEANLLLVSEKETLANFNGIRVKRSSVTNLFKCPACDKTFKSSNFITLHFAQSFNCREKCSVQNGTSKKNNSTINYNKKAADVLHPNVMNKITLNSDKQKSLKRKRWLYCAAAESKDISCKKAFRKKCFLSLHYLQKPKCRYFSENQKKKKRYCNIKEEIDVNRNSIGYSKVHKTNFKTEGGFNMMRFMKQRGARIRSMTSSVYQRKLKEQKKYFEIKDKQQQKKYFEIKDKQQRETTTESIVPLSNNNTTVEV